MNLTLYFQLQILRLYQFLTSILDLYLTRPLPLRPSFTCSIPSALSSRPGRISLYFYHSPSLSHSKRTGPLPLIVNFHGGAFIIGHPTDSARWATALLANIPAIFVSVGYRLAPAYPQPTAVEDCVDALRWLWAHAEEYGYDAQRTIVTGSSAGGNLAFGVPLREEREREAERARSTGLEGVPKSAVAVKGKITGIVAFYPSVNQAIPRLKKSESNPSLKVKGEEPEWLHRLVDAAYYRDLPAEGRASLNLSPALAPEQALKDVLPNCIGIWTCEFDKLLVEGEEFRETLKGLGKNTSGKMMRRMKHNFDHQGVKNKSEREEMYGEAVAFVKSMV